MLVSWGSLKVIVWRISKVDIVLACDADKG